MDAPASLVRRADVPAPAMFAGSSRMPPPDLPLGELRLMAYLRAVYRRWPVVLVTVLAAVAVTYWYARSLPTEYEARARILVDPQAPNVVTFTPVQEEWGSSEYYNTQFEILRSRALAERTIDRLDLWNHPELTGRDPGEDASPATEAAAGEAPGSVPPASERDPAVVSAFMGRLSASQVKQSRIVQISYISGDPRLAARVANAHAQVYMEQSLEERIRPNTDAASSLERLLADQKKVVDASEEALQRYREQHGNVSLQEGENVAQQKLLQLSSAMTAARTTRIQKGALYEQLRAIEERRAPLDTFPAFLANGFIQSLKAELIGLQAKEAQLAEQLGELHPDMVAVRVAIASAEGKLRAEIVKASEAVRNEYEAADASEKALARAVAQQQQEVLGRDRTAIEYANLQRAAVTNRQIYESLLQRSKETAVTSSIQSGAVRLVDAAQVPGNPLPRGEKMYALLAVFWGGALGVGFVFVLEFFDRRIKSPDDLEQHLSLSYVGCAPRIAGHVGQRLLDPGVPPEFTEALRTVGATLLGSAAGVAHSVLVTSATSGEGKTLMSGHLALALARIGKRVALVDADLRRPRLHELLGTSRGPGLADLLLGRARLDAAMQQTLNANLWLMPAGHPVASSDLLGSERLPELIARLTEAFDWVIVDSPPVLVAADASFLARAVSAVLMVVDARNAKRDLVQEAVERLEAVNARPIGAVLNRAERQRRDAYYYYPLSYEGDEEVLARAAATREAS